MTKEELVKFYNNALERRLEDTLKGNYTQIDHNNQEFRILGIPNINRELKEYRAEILGSRLYEELSEMVSTNLDIIRVLNENVSGPLFSEITPYLDGSLPDLGDLSGPEFVRQLKSNANEFHLFDYLNSINLVRCIKKNSSIVPLLDFNSLHFPYRLFRDFEGSRNKNGVEKEINKAVSELISPMFIELFPKVLKYIKSYTELQSLGNCKERKYYLRMGKYKFSENLSGESCYFFNPELMNNPDPEIKRSAEKDLDSILDNFYTHGEIYSTYIRCRDSIQQSANSKGYSGKSLSPKSYKLTDREFKVAINALKKYTENQLILRFQGVEGYVPRPTYLTTRFDLKPSIQDNKLCIEDILLQSRKFIEKKPFVPYSGSMVNFEKSNGLSESVGILPFFVALLNKFYQASQR